MIIAFMGIDGSGKSSTALALKERLERDFCGPVFYREEFNYVVLGHLFKLVGGNRERRARQKYLDATQKKRPWIYKVWPYLVWADCVLAYLWQRVLSLRGYTVICDRYFYDYVVAFEGLGDSSWLVHKLFLALPPPDVGILMDVPHEIAYERKKDTHRDPIEWFAMWRECYLKLNREINFSVVRSDRPFEQTLQQVASLVERER